MPKIFLTGRNNLGLLWTSSGSLRHFSCALAATAGRKLHCRLIPMLLGTTPRNHRQIHLQILSFKGCHLLKPYPSTTMSDPGQKLETSMSGGSTPRKRVRFKEDDTLFHPKNRYQEVTQGVDPMEALEGALSSTRMSWVGVSLCPIALDPMRRTRIFTTSSHPLQAKYMPSVSPRTLKRQRLTALAFVVLQH